MLGQRGRVLGGLGEEMPKSGTMIYVGDAKNEPLEPSDGCMSLYGHCCLWIIRLLWQ